MASTDFNDRTLSLGLARVSSRHTSAALIGRGDEAADQAAVNAMREQL
jgi:fructose-1,6-bisphosphatase/sedoheptulose 1,7-bisphosphatase-like protein